MTSASPTRAVLDAFAQGESSIAAIAARTGLAPQVVPVIVSELVRLGMVRQEVLGSGCPSSGGCGGCASASQGGAACGTSSERARGPVLLSLAAPTARR